MRKKMIAANWKMNITPSQAKELIKTLRPEVNRAAAEVVLCVPAIDIVPAVELLADTNVRVGAENMYFEEKGAYTGELSAEMLTDAGVTYVILGHSERRMYFHENDEMVHKKVIKAMEHGLIPIICCGETLDQREKNLTLQIIKRQIYGAFEGVSKEQAAQCVIAYEPVWAIGTGRVATAEQAQEVCCAVRTVLRNKYGSETADVVRILYGGSVNAKNAPEIFAQPDIDGGLVGGASLKMEFTRIVNYNRMMA